MIMDCLNGLTGPDETASADSLTRHGFLKIGAAAGGGLLLGLTLPIMNDAAEAATVGFSPNAFIRIEGDGRIVLTMPYVEMGQGTYTSIPMLIAEELEVDLAQVTLEHAPPDEKRYGNPFLGGVQGTGGSTTIRAAWQPLREAGATVRMMLVAAAAKRWTVDPATCRAQRGEILHEASGRSVDYGDIAAEAARVPIPAPVALKSHEDFKLIGTPAKRLDMRAKVDGSALYGIDIQLPGLKIATLAQSPVFGGRVKSVNETAATAVKNVRQIVRLDDAVAVVADHMGAARKGLAVLAIEWEDGPHAGLDTDDIVHELERATLGPGAVAQNSGDVVTAMAHATTWVEASYQVPFLAHATMEPMNCTVHVRKDGCEVWVGSQVIARVQAAAAETAGLPLDKVTVHNHLIGDLSLSAERMRGAVMSHRDWLIADSARAQLRQRWRELFYEFDVVLCPVMPTPAFPHDHSENLWSRSIMIDGASFNYGDQLVWAGMATAPGLPSTAVPVAQTDEGLPIGVQILGPLYEDRTPLRFAEILEQEFSGFEPPPLYALHDSCSLRR